MATRPCSSISTWLRWAIVGNIFCIDTFAGFTSDDARYEEQERGKSADWYRHSYRDASLTTFRRTLANNDITSVIAIKTDVAAWQPDLPSGVSFCLIDVDLYKPVLAALQKIVPLVQSGGRGRRRLQ